MLFSVAQTLSIVQVLMAAGLMAFVLLLSFLLRLNLTQVLIVASIRTIVQLSFVGLVLAWVFAQNHWQTVLLVLTIMTLIASISAKNRVKKPYKGLLLDTCLSLVGSGWLIAIFGVVVVLQTDDWYQPEILLPILGLILGNALTAVSLSLNHLTDSFHRERGQIVMMLSLSATPLEATRPHIINAIHQGVMPTINSMMVVGVVSLPGMMTGQILAGADVNQAVRYQIITMFFIAAGSVFACAMACFLAYRRFFDDYQRFVIPPK